MQKRRVYLIHLAFALQLSTPIPLAAAFPVDVNESEEQPHRSSVPWLPERYPSPDQAACHSGTSNRFCDPDSLLSQSDLQLLSEVLKDLPTRRIVLPRKCTSNENQEERNKVFEVEFAVALLRKVS
jgi:Modulator of levamisole receptor-1